VATAGNSPALEGTAMRISLGVLALLVLGHTTLAWSAAPPARYAGSVLSVNKAAGTITLGDTGPRLKSGKSNVTPVTIRVSPATEFVRVKRASGYASSGWFGDFNETKLQAWDVKQGDWVAVHGERDGGRVKAIRITVVEMGGS